jgi:hypothetical protein
MSILEIISLSILAAFTYGVLVCFIAGRVIRMAETRTWMQKLKTEEGYRDGRWWQESVPSGQPEVGMIWTATSLFPLTITLAAICCILFVIYFVIHFTAAAAYKHIFMRTYNLGKEPKKQRVKTPKISIPKATVILKGNV